MNKKENISQENEVKKGLEMYFEPKIVEDFAKLEQNEKNFKVAEIVDRILMQEIQETNHPIYSAELGGGAHPDRYHEFFKKLLQEPKGHIDWVDVSSIMLDLGKKYISTEEYQERKEIIDFVESDILEYLSNLDDEKLDIAIMKYTLNYLPELDKLFELLSKKLKSGGKLIATTGNLNSELKSFSTNARFLYNGEQFPDNETRTLKDGGSFTIKFFKVSGDPKGGYVEGAETVVYFHSADKIKQLAEFFDFDIFIGNWKDFVKQKSEYKEEMDEEMDHDILVLTKK